MKIFGILFSLLALSGLSHAQTLTQVFNEPAPGDLEIFYPLDTAAFTTGMPVNLNGGSCNWDFRRLNIMHPVDTVKFLDPATVSSATAYPNCSVVENTGIFVNYYRSVTTPTTQTEIIGVDVQGIKVKLTDPGIVMKYPGEYGLVISDPAAGNVTSPISATVNGNVNTVIDGMGTLNLPMGVIINDVLRVKTIINISANGGLGTMRQTMYSYFSTTSKFPVLKIMYTSVAFALSSPTVTAFASGNFLTFIDGVAEQKGPVCNVYPNPGSGAFMLSIDPAPLHPVRARIYALSGSLLWDRVLAFNGAGEAEVKAGLIPGLYVILIEDGKSRQWLRMACE